ncbi:rCG35876 [Rattus norvegicus]|uniref:RCG35876 n=1 Tax=Rattus norvegicus TaxID=10116 RepID=A6IJY9_RAT|nr:rCG35876 [Rattus norvegicus]
MTKIVIVTQAICTATARVSRRTMWALVKPWSSRAGEKHYHPSCALCVRCGQMFSEGEEMYLQGSSIWHPACRQAARTEDKSKETRTSSESIVSVPASSTSGSPSRVIYAKLGDEILDYRDLAALPKNKAIYNIDRPDMISYSPYISHSAVGDRQSYGEGDQDDRSYKQCRTSSPSSAGSVSLGHYTPTSRSPQHYSRPAGTVSVGTSSCLSLSQHPSPTSVFRHHYIPYFRDTGVKDNIYRKPPIYKQHAARRLDVEDSSFDQDSRKKTTWLLLKGDADTRTNSPDLDSQSLSLSSGADQEPLQRMPGDSLYSRELPLFQTRHSPRTQEGWPGPPECQPGPLWSRPGCQLGHAR